MKNIGIIFAILLFVLVFLFGCLDYVMQDINQTLSHTKGNQTNISNKSTVLNIPSQSSVPNVSANVNESNMTTHITNTTENVTNVGCDYNNPSCGTDLLCVNNSCIPKFEYNTSIPISNETSKAIQYLIITRPIFIQTLKSFEQIKTNQGFNISTVTLEQIDTNYTGKDVPEKIRNFLREAKERGVQYLLIVGDADSKYSETGELDYTIDQDWEIPMRYVSINGAPYKDGQSNDTIIPTDQYYASLSGSWDDDRDGIYGEEGLLYDEFDFKPDLYVGRFPVKTVSELETLIHSTENWVPKNRPIHSIFRSTFCPQSSAQSNEDELKQVINQGNSEMQDIIPHICQNDSGGDIAYFVNKDAADLVSSFSHGYNQAIVGNYTLDYSSEIIKKPVIFYVYGCLTNAIDKKDDSLSKHLLKEGSAIAYIGSTRSHADRWFNFWDTLYYDDNPYLGAALYEYKYKRYSTEILDDKEKGNFMMFNLMGDPSLKVYNPEIELKLPENVYFNSSNYAGFLFEVRNNKNHSVFVNIRTGEGTPKVDGILPGKSITQFHTEFYGDPQYAMYRLLIAEDNESTVAVGRTTTINNHALVNQEILSDLVPGRNTSIPLLVLYGKNETIEIIGEYYPGSWGNNYPETREGKELFRVTKDISINRKINVSFIVPENEVPLDDTNRTFSTPYYFPYIKIYSENVSSKGLLNVYFKN